MCHCDETTLNSGCRDAAIHYLRNVYVERVSSREFAEPPIICDMVLQIHSLKGFHIGTCTCEFCRS